MLEMWLVEEARSENFSMIKILVNRCRDAVEVWLLQPFRDCIEEIRKMRKAEEDSEREKRDADLACRSRVSKFFFVFLLFVVNIYLRSFSSHTSSSALLFLPSISDELALCIAVIGINFECLEPEIRILIFLDQLLKLFFFLLILRLRRTNTFPNIPDLSSHLYLVSYLCVCHSPYNLVSIFFPFL